MNNKITYLFFCSIIFWANSFSQTGCPKIDFHDYLNFNFNSSDCTYEYNGIIMQFFDFDPTPFCSAPNEEHFISEVKIQIEGIPKITGKDVALSVTEGGCGPFLFVWVYNDGSEGYFFGQAAIIEKFDELDYIMISDAECSLYHGSSYNAAILEFSEIPSDPTPPDNDPDIEPLESLLYNPSNLSRDDYHFYLTEDIVCDFDTYQGPYNCSVEDVFTKLQSQVNYQAPEPLDFPNITVSFQSTLGCLSIEHSDETQTTPYDIISSALITTFTSETTQPFENNEVINLTPNRLRIDAGIMAKIFGIGIDCLQTIEIANDPIKIIIDEENKCITNYTLPGHILYPGKIQRCIVSEDCGKTIKIVTKGEGFHYCGDTEIGKFFSCMNSEIGVVTFQNVNERFIEEFNN